MIPILAIVTVCGITCVMILLHILRVLDVLEENIYQLHIQLMVREDDINRPLEMDFDWNKKSRKAARFTDNSKRWINDRETASRAERR